MEYIMFKGVTDESEVIFRRIKSSDVPAQIMNLLTSDKSQVYLSIFGGKDSEDINVTCHLYRWIKRIPFIDLPFDTDLSEYTVYEYWE